MKVFAIAYRNVVKNWRHSLAAVISVGVALISQVMFQGYIERIEQIYEDSYRHRAMVGDLIIENENTFRSQGRENPYKYFLTKTEQEKLQNFLDQEKNAVVAVNPVLEISGMINNGRTNQIFFGFAYDPQAAARIRAPDWTWNALYGIPLQNTADENSILPAEALAHRLGCDANTKFSIKDGFAPFPTQIRPFTCQNPNMQLTVMTSTNQVNAMNLNVVGIMKMGYKDLNSRYVELPLKVAQTLINTDGLSYISVLLKDPKLTTDFINDFNRSVRTSNSELRAVSWKDHPLGEVYNNVMGILHIFRNFVLIVIFCISCLSVLNTMIKIVKERTREVGTLRSLGYSAGQVQKIFIFEALLLCTWGSFLGAGCAVLLSLLLNSLGIQYTGGMTDDPVVLNIVLDLRTYLLSFSLLLFLSVIATYIACLGSLRKKIVENFSYA